VDHRGSSDREEDDRGFDAVRGALLMDPSLPQKIGRYEIVGHLATGGMAEVLLARLIGPSGFERPVVVKRILPHLARTREFVDMFVDEARIVAGIRHPNVVAVHELGREGEELFLVLEYLEGESASGLMRRLTSLGTKLDYRLAAHVVAEACAGLHAAHELVDSEGRKQELVHRDMTPQNLFVTYDGAVKVLDFGVAKATDRMAKTEAGQIKGKFEYMSPEQCLGKPLDRRSDIFALGVVLYEMSTGTRLFKRSTQLVTMKAICDEAIRPPSSLRPDYPPALEQIVMTALKRSPSERWATAAQMRRALLTAMRDLEPPPSAVSALLPEEALGALMHDVFGDRIETKAELLRRVRAGSRVEELPTAETDGSVEIPVAIDEAMTEHAASVEAPPRAERRSRVPIFAALVALIAAGLGVVVVMRHHEAAVAPLPSATSAPAIAASSAPALSTTATVAASVAVRVESTPDGASVFAFGRVAGTTPYVLDVPKSDQAFEIEVRKDGFVTQKESIVPNMEQRVRLTLPAAAHAVRPQSTVKPATSSTAGGFHRFD
jgi:serine/threonine-protein kinase